MLVNHELHAIISEHHFSQFKLTINQNADITLVCATQIFKFLISGIYLLVKLKPSLGRNFSCTY